MKIAVLDFDHLHNHHLNAGQARATYELAIRWVKKGHDVTVICSKYPGWMSEDIQGIHFRHIGLGSSNIKLNNAAYILHVPFILQRLQADVIMECFTAPISTLCSPLFTKIPVVGVPTSFEARRFSHLYHLPFHLIERYGSRCYTYFAPYTVAIQNRMLAYNPSIISRIIPEGVGPEYFAIQRKKPKHILFLGRFDVGQKGIDMLLSAYHAERNTISFPLVIAGHGSGETEIRKIIRQLSLEDRVKIVGSAYGEKKHKLLEEAVCVVMPSRHEGFSLFSLEALASGLPIVAFDIDGFSWAPETVVRKAPSFDIQAYGRILRECVQEGINTRRANKIKSFASAYSWDTVSEEFESFFSEIIKQKRSL